MKFIVGTEYDLEGQLEYLVEEYSILGSFDETDLGVGSAVVNDLQLGIDENGWVVSVYGYCPIISSLPKTDSCPFEWQRKRLRIVGNEPWQLGDALVIDSERWPTVANPHQGWVCIGDVSLQEKDQLVEFFPNAVAALRANLPVAIWLRPKIIRNS